VAGQLQEIGRLIEQLAGKEARQEVMRGSDQMSPTGTPAEVALCCRKTIDRLDALVNQSVRDQIMAGCGRHCQSLYDLHAEALKQQRLQYTSEAEFLAHLQAPDASLVFECRGDDLIQYHIPSKAGHGMRCSCFLMAALPEGTNASPTFCQCSRAFVQQRWESVLGRPLRVEVKETAITGSDHCRFIIHLHIDQ
jgi:hypothetical protein